MTYSKTKPLSFKDFMALLLAENPDLDRLLDHDYIKRMIEYLDQPNPPRLSIFQPHRGYRALPVAYGRAVARTGRRVSVVALDETAPRAYGNTGSGVLYIFAEPPRQGDDDGTRQKD